jgi:hypothetical protein
MQLTSALVGWLLPAVLVEVLVVLTPFENAAAKKLAMKKTSAMTTIRKSTSRDLLVVLMHLSCQKRLVFFSVARFLRFLPPYG